MLKAPSAGEDVEQQENSFIAGGNTKWKTKLHSLLPYDLAITLLDIYPNKLKTYIHTKVVVIVQLLSWIRLATPQTITCQAPLSIGFSRQESQSGLPFPSSRGIFPTQGSNLRLLHQQVDSLPLSHQGSPFTQTQNKCLVNV